MQTTLTLNDSLMQEASQLTGISKEQELVDEAIKILILFKKQKKLSDLRGKIQFADDYDYKSLRN
jgi:hypothetical protein